MKTLLVPMLTCLSAVFAPTPAGAAALDLDFDDGVGAWRVVVDGVMGGRSSGRVSQTDPGILQFTGDLSLENNGGFSQIRASVPGAPFEGAEGLELRVRGDERVYKFDIRCSDVRLMAGAFQQDFETGLGWTTIRLPFEGFRLYSFGRRVTDAPALTPTNIEAIGVTLADKNPGPFRLEIASIRTYGGVDDVATAPTRARGDDLASVARAAGLNTLLDLVAAAGLELPADERVTIFAPSDAAFDALPEATVKALLRPEGRDALRSILTYHVAVPALSAADLLARRSIPTLNGQRLTVETGDSISIDGAALQIVDVPFAGGVVHVINQVLAPEMQSIVELAAASDRLGTLAAAVAAAGLAEQLGAANGPWTVFAPVDSAFESLPEGALGALLEPQNRGALVEVLGLHVVPGRLYAGDLLASRSAQALTGSTLDFSLEDGRLRVASAKVITADIEAANGVVHLIDRVILPDPDEVNSADVATVTKSVRAARLCELAISRGVPLFNAGQTAACASIYEITVESLLALGGDDLGRDVTDRLRRGLEAAKADHNSSDRAWTLRRVLDDTYERLMRRATSTETTARSALVPAG